MVRWEEEKVSWEEEQVRWEEIQVRLEVRAGWVGRRTG